MLWILQKMLFTIVRYLHLVATYYLCHSNNLTWADCCAANAITCFRIHCLYIFHLELVYAGVRTLVNNLSPLFPFAWSRVNICNINFTQLTRNSMLTSNDVPMFHGYSAELALAR